MSRLACRAIATLSSRVCASLQYSSPWVRSRLRSGSHGTWQVYMGSPWTRDGTVRAYVVTMAPEVAGRIVKLSVADDRFVHKGDVLFEIEPADYRIALESAQAQLQRDGAALDYARANENRKASLAKEGWTSTDIYQQTTSTLHQSEGLIALDKAAVAKGQLDLSRTVISSPVSGYVTNLLAHLGGVARGINIPNAQPDQAGLASVNPIFTWVRLAQRVPVRLHIDQVPDGVRLVAGMTATVQIDPQPKASKR